MESREVLSGVTGPAPPHVLEVHQGDPHASYQTIQAAVDAAHPGDTIKIFGGTYKEAVTVSTPGLTLKAAPGNAVQIQNPGGAENGVTVQGAGGAPLVGFTLADVTVRGFASDGVFLSGVTNFLISHVSAQDNAEYGIFPVLSANGLITASSASGSNDTGIYVGQSSHVTVLGNVASNNVNGIEIENCVGVRALANVVFDNTVGILEDLLPGFPLPFEVASDNVIAGNLVFHNNRPNTAPSDDIASVETPGTGIALVGGNRTLVQDNLVVGNAFAGIAVLSGKDLLTIAPPGTPPYPSGVDPNPDNTLVQQNTVVGNGFFAGPLPSEFPHPADLVWTGSGANNHWRFNVFLTSTPGHLP
jgi:parallel beta-helix repeat protein